MQFEVGSIVEGKVNRITKFGAFVELAPGKTGMVHISEVANSYVNDINDFLQESAKDLEKKTFARGNDIFAFSWWMAQQDAQSVLNAKENGRLYKEQTVSYQFHLSAPKA